jgi:glutamate-ammonia-ligase adenylyltransferase
LQELPGHVSPDAFSAEKSVVNNSWLHWFDS